MKEEENLFGSESEQTFLLQAQLKDWLENLWRPAFAKKKKIDDKTEEALKALGYIK